MAQNIKENLRQSSYLIVSYFELTAFMHFPINYPFKGGKAPKQISTTTAKINFNL